MVIQQIFKFVAGGCVVRDDDPKWECKDCGNRFKRKIKNKKYVY